MVMQRRRERQRREDWPDEDNAILLTVCGVVIKMDDKQNLIDKERCIDISIKQAIHIVRISIQEKFCSVGGQHCPKRF